MAAGCGIVVSTAAIHDAIDHDQTGMRVPPGDSSALARAILRLLEDPALRLRLGARARQVAVERYSWENTVAQLESLFHSVVAR